MRKKHTEKQWTEPWVEWERIRFPKIPENLEKEIKAEAETDEDLTKSIPQLVCDFNTEVLKLSPIGADRERILLTAQKRMVAMMAQFAMKNDKVSDRMIELTNRIIGLTRWLLRLTVVIAVLTAAMIAISFFKN